MDKINQNGGVLDLKQRLLEDTFKTLDTNKLRGVTELLFGVLVQIAPHARTFAADKDEVS